MSFAASAEIKPRRADCHDEKIDVRRTCTAEFSAARACVQPSAIDRDLLCRFIPANLQRRPQARASYPSFGRPFALSKPACRVVPHPNITHKHSTRPPLAPCVPKRWILSKLQNHIVSCCFESRKKLDAHGALLFLYQCGKKILAENQHKKSLPTESPDFN
ncbi:MAG TPA: hypothetical protein VMD27_00130 [Candidatus Aquilonibacter sp.]|nr:hypothetical protein [Candidatus Aquilonibacter sp.]